MYKKQSILEINCPECGSKISWKVVHNSLGAPVYNGLCSGCNIIFKNREIPEITETIVVTCVYCGHQYPDGTPTTKHELLTEHIKTCEKHPMRDAEQKIKLITLLCERWRAKAITLREEAGRIRRTVKCATGAKVRCIVRAEIYDTCAIELDNTQQLN